ncbi:hypothetical protein M3Y98_01115100 [Aphelenchoides besseyi]|nr:hypothetical protein M3Y98_01115100 [Aphelenchoides besseyi]KAI6209181.1 hypothetical protein M3Y96_00194300 [Aphelenchoides besseyi]
MISLKKEPFSSMFLAKSPPEMITVLSTQSKSELKLVDYSRSQGPGSVESNRSFSDQSENLPFDISVTSKASQCSTSNELDRPLCLVCGDWSNGVHYNVQSCNGCKTFYRRTVVSGRKFTCKNNNKCLDRLDKNKRCSCRACRWRKCVEIGMNSNAIQYTPSANLTLSIARKRFQRTLRNTSSTDNNLSISRGLSQREDQILQCIDQVLYLDEKFDRLRCSMFYDYDETVRLSDLVNRPSVAFDANKYPVVERWPDRCSTGEASLKEMQKLGLKFWFYNDMYLGVEYIKSVPVFRDLSSQDRCSLILSNALKDSMLSASYSSYLKRNDCFIIYPDGWTPFQNKAALIEIEKALRRGVVPEIYILKPDQIQFSLMRVICALNYNCVELSEAGREIVEAECSRYQNALLSYLQNKHGCQQGTRRFGDSMALLTVVCQRLKHNYDYFAFKRCILRIPPCSVLFGEIMTQQILPKQFAITER